VDLRLLSGLENAQVVLAGGVVGYDPVRDRARAVFGGEVGGGFGVGDVVVPGQLDRLDRANEAAGFGLGGEIVLVQDFLLIGVRLLTSRRAPPIRKVESGRGRRAPAQ